MKKLIPVILLAGGCLFAAPRFSIGVGVGAPPPAIATVRPPCPGPGYTWVDGYWAGDGAWVNGYWAPPYNGSYFVNPAPIHRDRDDYRDHGRDRNHFRDRDRDHHDRDGFHDRR